MTKRQTPTKPPAKGVPMPDSYYFICGWGIDEETGMRYPKARLLRWRPELIKPREVLREYRSVLAWLANPETPKGVRR